LDRRTLEGLLLGVASALLGGAWQVATRQATTTHFAPEQLALFRYGIPALLFLPLLLRTGLLPRAMPRSALALMVIGAGLPFGLVAMSGTRFAPAAHMGVLMAGAAPLFAAAASWWLWRERPGAQRSAGLALMALGVAVLGAHTLATIELRTLGGDALFLLAAALWTGYTLSFRRSGLTPFQGAALVNAWSLLLLLPVLLWRGVSFGDVPLAALVSHGMIQGVMAGVLGLWTFTAAIARLGPAGAAAFGAMVPVVTAVGAWAWLGERPSAVDWLAIAAAVAGVALASGALPALRRVRTPRPA